MTSAWDNRIGQLTYSEAVEELGQPVAVETLPDGQMLAKWISHYSMNGNTVDLDNGYYTRSPSFNVSRLDAQESRLCLKFDTNNVLVDWDKD